MNTSIYASFDVEYNNLKKLLFVQKNVFYKNLNKKILLKHQQKDKQNFKFN